MAAQGWELVLPTCPRAQVSPRAFVCLRQPPRDLVVGARSRAILLIALVGSSKRRAFVRRKCTKALVLQAPTGEGKGGGRFRPALGAQPLRGCESGRAETPNVQLGEWHGAAKTAGYRPTADLREEQYVLLSQSGPQRPLRCAGRFRDRHTFGVYLGAHHAFKGGDRGNTAGRTICR